ncbi:NADH:ubiquinone oxidoreductase, 24 kDa subunit [Candidatus Magnetomorum sp. HK-1]|nr:NADH:ubiquinone oxidoreductase, 24 kDa subunit [Candidatus Magnetomorum sp. HK-1]
MLNLEKPEHPDITSDMWNNVDNIIIENQQKPGALISVLRRSQDVVGYLPTVLMDYISVGLNISKSEVYGVATFYSLFSMTPKGRHTIKVCMGTACYVKGIKETVERITNEHKIGFGETSSDRRFSMESVRCLGACGLAPVVVIGQDTLGDVKADNILNILNRYE